MARLQDFQTVTPTASDKLLVVQSQGQGLVPYGSKLDMANPTGTGSLSLNRKANTTVGTNSVAVGGNCTASGTYSRAEGYNTTATSTCSTAEGSASTSSGTASHAEGYNTTASGDNSHTEGNTTVASGSNSHAEGYQTEANHRAQHVFGEFNVKDTSTADANVRGNYVEIVGKGTANNARSNARTLDWSGNEVLAGGLKINGTTDVGDALKAVKRYIFNSSSPITIGVYGGVSLLVMGFVQGIGNVFLAVSASGSSIESVTNILTGQAFSSQYLTFSASSNVITISSSSSSNSDVTVFAGGRIS